MADVEAQATKVRSHRVTRGSGVALLAILVVGCSGLARGCGDTQFATPFVLIYNRTLTSVRVGDAWVPICAKGVFDLAHWPTPWPPQVSPPPGAPHVSVDLGVSSDYNGNVSVIVSESGVEVIRGDIEEKILPKCAGVPPTRTGARALRG
jgi:hypothetical protein